MWFLASRRVTDPARARLGDQPLLAPTHHPTTDPPIVQPVEAVGGRYRLVAPYVPDLPEAVARLVPICIPADASAADAWFNGASVPWQAWWFLRPMEPRVVAGALVHDMLYLQRGELRGTHQARVVSRNFADLAFFVLMVRSGLEPYRAWVAFIAVRTFSGPLFRRGQPLPTPDPLGQRAEHLLAREAWEVVQSPAHRGSFARLAAILTGFLLIGGWSVGWVCAAGHDVPLPVWLTTFILGGAMLFTAVSVLVATARVGRALSRRSGRPPQDDGR